LTLKFNSAVSYRVAAGGFGVESVPQTAAAAVVLRRRQRDAAAVTRLL